MGYDTPSIYYQSGANRLLLTSIITLLCHQRSCSEASVTREILSIEIPSTQPTQRRRQHLSPPLPPLPAALRQARACALFTSPAARITSSVTAVAATALPAVRLLLFHRQGRGT